MRKHVLDMVVTRATELRPGYVELRLAVAGGELPAMAPGQFVQVRVDGEPATFLRRPISINNVADGELWLLIHAVGPGTRWLTARREGDVLNVVGPLGRGFDLNAAGKRPLLVGGGVGTAPLLLLGRQLKALGAQPTFILGARSAADLLQTDLFRQLGTVGLTTEDGSAGEQGFVTQHSAWQQGPYTSVCTCGPLPMMKAVARLARELQLSCQASLENMMACGLGACLCCVEDTVEGHVCVCTEGPVFETDKLKW